MAIPFHYPPKRKRKNFSHNQLVTPANLERWKQLGWPLGVLLYLAQNHPLPVVSNNRQIARTLIDRSRRAVLEVCVFTEANDCFEVGINLKEWRYRSPKKNQDQGAWEHVAILTIGQVFIEATLQGVRQFQRFEGRGVEQIGGQLLHQVRDDDGRLRMAFYPQYKKRQWWWVIEQTQPTGRARIAKWPVAAEEFTHGVVAACEEVLGLMAYQLIEGAHTTESKVKC